MKKKNVAVDRLKVLVSANINAGIAEQRQLQAIILQELGPEGREGMEEFSVNKEVDAHFVDWISGVFARRLKSNQRPLLVFTYLDYAHFVSEKTEAIALLEGVYLDSHNRSKYEGHLKRQLRNILEELRDAVPFGYNLYQGYWRWVKAAYKIADELDMHPEVFITTASASDLITKRTLNKEQYSSYCQKITSILMSIAAEAQFSPKELKSLGKVVKRFYKKRMSEIYH